MSFLFNSLRGNSRLRDHLCAAEKTSSKTARADNSRSIRNGFLTRLATLLGTLRPKDDTDGRKTTRLDIACHLAAKKYSGGIAELAADFGLAGDFQERLNPVLPGCINLDEFIAILSATRDQGIIDALAEIVQVANRR